MASQNPRKVTDAKPAKKISMSDYQAIDKAKRQKALAEAKKVKDELAKAKAYTAATRFVPLPLPPNFLFTKISGPPGTAFL